MKEQVWNRIWETPSSLLFLNQLTESLGYHLIMTLYSLTSAVNHTSNCQDISITIQVQQAQH